MSATDWCLDLYFSQQLLLSKIYTLPQNMGKYNPVIFQMGEQKRLQKIASDSAGNKTRGQTTYHIYIKCIQMQEKMYFRRCLEQLLSNLVATQHATA